MTKAKPRTTRKAAAPRRRVSTRKITPPGRPAGRPKARARATRSRALTAPDTLQVSFDLRDVGQQRIVDPETFFTFRQLSGNRQLGDQLQVHVSGRPLAFTVPASHEVLVCEVDPKRYRFAFSPVFFGTPGTRVDKTITLWREPAEWTPTFTGWDALPRAFASLKKVLRTSRDVTLFDRSRPDQVLAPRLDGPAYDDLAGAEATLAKTALLNIFCRLQSAREPIGDDRPWFSFVTKMLSMGRERIIAMVEPSMYTLVHQVHEHIDRFSADYERTPAANHRPNVPTTMQPRIVDMVSIKSAHRHGNFQLTLTHLRDPDEVLLDADIDESGDLLGHCLDLFKHKISGGTHPHDIHEILLHQHDPAVPLDLGYRLV
jgi:hypothetical protein